MPIAMKPYLSVIISAFNEEENYNRGVLDEVLKYLSSQKFTWEIILVNDGSSDNTSELLHKFSSQRSQVQVIDNPHMGKALGIITGALKARGEIVMFTDMDQATPIDETGKMLDKINQGYDIVIGSRTGRKGAPLFRQILAVGNIILRTLILRLPFKDTQCGFKAFRGEAAHKIFTIMDKLRPRVVISGPAVDPGFDVELLYLGRKLGYKIVEVPVTWQYKESRRVRFVYDAISGLYGLLIVRWRSLAGSYKYVT